MDLICAKEDLANVVSTAARVLSAHPQQPVYSRIYLEARGNKLRATATDGSTVARAVIKAQVKTSGAVLVPGARFARLVTLFGGSEVAMTASTEKLVVTSGASRTGFALDMSELPIPTHDLVADGTVGSDLFAEAVEQVMTATGSGADTPLISTIWLTMAGDALELSATDRYRLSWRKLGWQPQEGATAETVGVPAKVLAEVARAAGRAGAEIAIAHAAGHVSFSTGAVTIETKTSAQTAPDMAPVVQLTPEAKVTATRAVLLDALARVQVLADDAADSVTLEFSPEASAVRYQSTAEGTEISEPVAAVTKSTVTVALRISYLMGALRAIGTDTVRIGHCGAKKPVLFAPKDGSAEHRQVVMSR